MGIGWGLLAAGIHAVMYVFVLSSSINGLCHHVGYKNFDNTATNLRLLALVTGGEGLHNNHHGYPRSPKFSFRASEIDPAWPIIKLLIALGLAKPYKTIEEVAARVGLASAAPAFPACRLLTGGGPEPAAPAPAPPWRRGGSSGPRLRPPVPPPSAGAPSSGRQSPARRRESRARSALRGRRCGGRARAARAGWRSPRAAAAAAEHLMQALDVAPGERQLAEPRHRRRRASLRADARRPRWAHVPAAAREAQRHEQAAEQNRVRERVGRRLERARGTRRARRASARAARRRRGGARLRSASSSPASASPRNVFSADPARRIL